GPSPYASASYANLDLNNTWVMIEGETRPMLRSEASTTIVNAHQLQLMDLNLAGQYTLGADFSAAETTSETAVWNPANGFVPVRGAVASPFTGSLDGRGHTISDLTVVATPGAVQTVDAGASSGFAGLFGVLGTSSAVRTLNLDNAAVSAGGGMEAGILAGYVL